MPDAQDPHIKRQIKYNRYHLSLPENRKAPNWSAKGFLKIMRFEVAIVGLSICAGLYLPTFVRNRARRTAEYNDPEYAQQHRQ